MAFLCNVGTLFRVSAPTCIGLFLSFSSVHRLNLPPHLLQDVPCATECLFCFVQLKSLIIFLIAWMRTFLGQGDAELCIVLCWLYVTFWSCRP